MEFDMSQPHPTTERREYTLQGMTCAHCAMSVREEVSEVPGVSAVDVDHASGRLTVTGRQLDDEAIGAAVDEAGYQVVG
jgi:copper chaperone CopZ